MLDQGDCGKVKPTLVDCIVPYQSSFILGRKIQDNIIIVKELNHCMKKIKGKRGFIAIKIDFEKAYDRPRWNFLHDCLNQFSLTPHIIKVIMEPISSATYNVLWNSGKTDDFLPSHGIQQGDLISLYLFVICMDKLSQLIDDSIKNGVWKPIKVHRMALTSLISCFSMI